MIPTLEDFYSPVWWCKNTKYAVQAVTKDNMDGGFSATLDRLTITLENGDKKVVILKMILPGSVSLSVNSPFGVARECAIFQEFSSLLSPNINIPTCFYAYGDLETDEKYLLIEDLTPFGYIQAGYFFNPDSPFNMGRDLPALTAGFQGITDKAVISKAAFESIAYLHATFWSTNCNSTNENGLKAPLPSYLRGTAWPTGGGKEQWLKYQNFAKSHWQSKPTRGLQWNPQLFELVEASLAKVDWDIYQRSLLEKPYTVIHGDFHPANCLIAKGKSDPSSLDLSFIDWEMSGIGSGPQELAHFFICSTPPSTRRAIEKDLVAAYHTALVKFGVKNYSFEDALSDYALNGMAKWLWILCVSVGMEIVPDAMIQYFHDQLADFMITHNITPENVPMTIV